MLQSPKTSLVSVKKRIISIKEEKKIRFADINEYLFKSDGFGEILFSVSS